MVYKGFSPSCYWSLRRKEALAHSSSSARLATPRLVTTRRAAGCGIEPSRAHSYALLFAGQERRVFDRWGDDLRRRIVGYRLGRGFSPRLSTRSRTYICGVLPTLAATTQNASPPPRPRRSSAATAAGDSVPFTAYTVDGRAGLRNHASPDPVRGEGRLGFWVATTRLLASVHLRPHHLRHHHVDRRRPCRC